MRLSQRSTAIPRSRSRWLDAESTERVRDRAADSCRPQEPPRRELGKIRFDYPNSFLKALELPPGRFVFSLVVGQGPGEIAGRSG